MALEGQGNLYGDICLEIEREQGQEPIDTLKANRAVDMQYRAEKGHEWRKREGVSKVFGKTRGS
jgi:hypothetical protein